MTNKRRKTLNALEQQAEDKLRASRQPRFNNQDRSSIFWSTYTWAKRAAQEEPPYAPNSPKRDKWLREYVLNEPFIHGVLANVVSVDKNRGWTMLGAEHIVRDYVERFHNLHASPDQKGWRPFTSFMSQTYHNSDLGAVAEIEWTAINLHNGFHGELNSLYTVDPVQCRLTGDTTYPLAYSANEVGLGPQDWSPNAYFRLTDSIYTDVNYNGLGVCAISRALELAKILTALYEHDAEQLLSKAPRGLLLLNGISEEQWESTLEARAQSMSELERKYYTGVQVFAGNGMEKVQAELVSLSKIPDGLDHVSFTNLVMNLYALAFKYDPREFWPVSGGQLGTATETETQHKKATGKGGMDFILSYQENLQDLLPPTVEFEFEARDVDGEIKDESLTTMIVNNIVAMATNNYITEDQARVMLAEAEIIHKDWADTSFQVTTDQEDNPEHGKNPLRFLAPQGSLFAKPSPQALFGAKSQTLSFLNSPAGAKSLSFLQQKKSPIADFLKKRNSKLVMPETEARLEDYIEVDKEAIARSLFYFPDQRIVKYVERQGIGRYEAIELKRKARTYSFTNRGGEGSGNYGHQGRPGEVGGSGAGGTSAPASAINVLNKGKTVTVEDEQAAAQLLDGIQKNVADAMLKGEKAPDYDLCKVSVPGTNLFCGDSKGIPRSQMPQFSTKKPVAGSEADKMPRNEKGEVEGTQNFKEYLVANGVSTTSTTLPASSLKATQNQLDGAKIVGMINNSNFDPMGEPIFVSNDGYVIDGHHRWAAQIGRDLRDGTLGGLDLQVTVVDRPIMEILPMANEWAVEFGFPQADVKERGGSGSGNFGHDGRPGEVGGSGGSSANTSSNYTRDTPFGNISGSKKVSAETYKGYVDDCMSKFDASRLPSDLQVVNNLDKDMQTTLGLKIKSDGLLEHNGILINGVALRSQRAIILSHELGEDDALGRKPPGCPADVWKALGKSPDTNPGLRYGKDKLNDTLTHEVAHILYDTNKTSGNIKTDTIIAKMKEAFPKISAQYKALPDYKTREQFLKKIGISSYAMTNVDEFIAVTFQYSHRNEETQSFVSGIIGDTASVEYFMGVPE